MDDREFIIVAILAAGDATWTPLRTGFADTLAANTYFARKAFAKGGVEYQSLGIGEGQRKARQRALESLVNDRLVVRSHPRRLKASSAKLSDEAEAMARAIVGLPSFDDCLSAMHYLRHYAIEGGGKTATSWLNEIPMTAGMVTDYGQTKDREARDCLIDIEDRLLPALIRGWVESNATMRGHVFYRLTDVGLDVLGNDVVLPTAPKGVRYSSEAHEHYNERFAATQNRLASMRQDIAAEIGILPLPMAVMAP